LALGTQLSLDFGKTSDVFESAFNVSIDQVIDISLGCLIEPTPLLLLEVNSLFSSPELLRQQRNDNYDAIIKSAHQVSREKNVVKQAILANKAQSEAMFRAAGLIQQGLGVGYQNVRQSAHDYIRNTSQRVKYAQEKHIASPRFQAQLQVYDREIERTKNEKPKSFYGRFFKAYKLSVYEAEKDDMFERARQGAIGAGLFPTSRRR